MTDDRVTLRFVPENMNCSEFDQLEPLFDELQSRQLDSSHDLQRWLEDYSELTTVISEHGTRLRIAHACDTESEKKEQAYLHFVEHVRPKIEPRTFELDKKFVACPHRAALTGPRYELLGKHWQTDVELYRDENVPLQTELTKLATDYGKLCGKMIVEFRGETYTLQQMGRFLDEPDRASREEAWRLVQRRRLEDRERIDDIFDRMLDKRRTVAANADCDDYRAYVWRDWYRFDYTPDDCLEFADAIAACCVPVVEALDRERRDGLGVERLRPWDLGVDPKGRPPLRPFDPNNVEAFVARTRAALDRVSPQLGEQFAELKMGENLDLDSRQGKRPGGFQSSLELVRQPFIFMNAAGLQRDVETLLHEAGHAFHYLASRAEPLIFLRHAPLEFCEVASMSMELLASPHFDVFYDDEGGANRARRDLLEGIIRFFPWMATIDSFQHRLYTSGTPDAAERTRIWLEIRDRFESGELDHTDLEAEREALWQRQLHLFHYPFYYIEYGIAQLGALQVWRNYRHDPEATLKKLLDAFALGGSRPLPELFETAGIEFDFSRRTLDPLIAMVRYELARIP